MLATFSLLGCLFPLLSASWLHFAPLAAFAVALGRFFGAPERSGIDFGGSWGSPGRVLEPPGLYFSRFFRPIAALLLQTPHMQKTMVFTGDPRKLANLAFFAKIDSLLRAGYKITWKSLPELS